MSKRSYESAFERRFLKSVDVDGFYVKIDMFKVIKPKGKRQYDIITTENNNFTYSENVITQRSKSATAFDQEKKLTKTELIELFAAMSVNDVWSAEYETFDKSAEWQKELATTIHGLSIEKAGEYIKKNFKSFGKSSRSMIGHKINPNSDNNYYTVRDLNIHFNLIEDGVDVEIAQKKSIRNLDVNSLQFLVFNGIKYILKSKKIVENENE